ncbi:tannase/feruloyl esterase family alpha/beta hydrolase [Cupriavidus necator]
MISWHGGADSPLSGRDHVRNFMAMPQLAGAGAANARFYLEPGVGHVQGGVGPDQVDYLGGMIDWVEKSVAPEQLQSSKMDARQTVVRTMPLCVYPKFPKYSGSGDASLAASYSCATN